MNFFIFIFLNVIFAQVSDTDLIISLLKNLDENKEIEENLDYLQDFLHQIDNANNLHLLKLTSSKGKRSGLEVLLKFLKIEKFENQNQNQTSEGEEKICENENEEKILAKTAQVLSVAVLNNLPFQKTLFDLKIFEKSFKFVQNFLSPKKIYFKNFLTFFTNLCRNSESTLKILEESKIFEDYENLILQLEDEKSILRVINFLQISEKFLQTEKNLLEKIKEKIFSFYSEKVDIQFLEKTLKFLKKKKIKNLEEQVDKFCRSEFEFCAELKNELKNEL